MLEGTRGMEEKNRSEKFKWGDGFIQRREGVMREVKRTKRRQTEKQREHEQEVLRDGTCKRPDLSGPGGRALGQKSKGTRSRDKSLRGRLRKGGKSKLRARVIGDWDNHRAWGIKKKTPR